jgi:succinate-semialdehyde dehydrogenase/glutarate-semialdehyde dehydrogenase
LLTIPLTNLHSTNVDPATEEEIGTVPEMGVVETKEAIEAAAVAFKTWSKTTAQVPRDFLSCFQIGGD